MNPPVDPGPSGDVIPMPRDVDSGSSPENDFARARAAVNTIEATVSKLVKLVLGSIDKSESVEQQSVELTAAFHAATKTIHFFMENGESSVQQKSLSKAERLRESIREVKGLIEDAEGKLAIWERELLATYEEAEGVQSA